MKKNLMRVLTTLLVGASLVGSAAYAADHLDSPGANNDPTADINDVYVFRSGASDANNTRRTVFVMTLIPAADGDARLSPNVEYRFWIRDADTQDRLDIVCTATPGPDQTISCEGPNGASDSVAFNAIEAGNGNVDNMRIFAGLREDPFFFDLDAFFAVVGDPGQVGQLVDDQGTDFFANFNAVALVVDVKNEIFGNASSLEVYAMTTRNGLDR